MAKSKMKNNTGNQYDYGQIDYPPVAVNLDLRTFAVENRIDEWIARDNVKMDAFVPRLMQGMFIELRAHIYGRDMKTVEVSYPADWKEHFKQRWFPAWAKAKWPVKYRTEKLVAEELYPHIALPERGSAVIRVYKQETKTK